MMLLAKYKSALKEYRRGMMGKKETRKQMLPGVYTIRDSNPRHPD